ncbi:MAG: NAD(P)/FAD-dependent oxidoreductase [Candidatus Methanomethylophilaceae archaeon]|jgi:digeranylgeranylglycerophospholipid reductase|nr:geranylgeranyl reductase [Methanomassiliicoccales archaeon RumEn M2]MDD2532106.1 NAD(P)/FAD-dependent oxidoreductase [Candidatus Methanomethylophilaceae archaeon]MDI9378989.1 NAD(P)/FAD-dependent oxidoreductase [Candidatus Thermoplasmatota archaeon]MDD2778644.1 NAD(P)/FAD-dependent oxidoreductase [Candidatus Methanomethylophilaceae archaeon]MDD3128286.1 NAD(P)/FAD-dependent oxidoreductase [Candidatus Methanomethylophilaceae archaeon]
MSAKRYDCDIVVVGGGPGGSMAAKYCAEGGLKTIMIEKDAEIGAPLRCAEGVSKKWLTEVGIEPDPAWICADMVGAIIKSPSGHKFKLDESQAGSEVGYVLERHLFDKHLAAMAAEAGAEIMMRTGCTGVIKDKKGKLVGVKAKSMGEPIEIYAKCVVAADGFESQVARWAGMDTVVKLSDIVTCLQYRMTNIDIDAEYCEFVIGSPAPGGYVWIFPKGKNIANVGLGVQGTKCKLGADPKHYLDKFIAEDPRLSKGQILEVVGGIVSTNPGLDEAIADNLVLVGDAARIIDPITGGGICHACRTGMYAGKVLTECAKKNDFSKEALKPYEKMWRDRMEDKLYRNFMAKERLAELDDKTIDELVMLIQDSDIKEVNVYNLLKVVKEKFPQVVEGFEDLI